MEFSLVGLHSWGQRYREAPHRQNGGALWRIPLLSPSRHTHKKKIDASFQPPTVTHNYRWSGVQVFSGDIKESQRLGSAGAVRPFVGYGRQLLLAGLREVRRWFGCTFWNEHRAREAVLPSAARVSSYVRPWLQAAECAHLPSTTSWAINDVLVNKRRPGQHMMFLFDGEPRCHHLYPKVMIDDRNCSAVAPLQARPSTADWSRGTCRSGLSRRKIPGWVDAQRHVGQGGAWKDFARREVLEGWPGGMFRKASIDLAWSVDPELDVPRLCVFEFR